MSFRYILHTLLCHSLEQFRFSSILFHVSERPEGGWEEPNELDMFMERGFQKVTLGTRALRSDVAVVSLLALAHEVCSKHRGHD